MNLLKRLGNWLSTLYVPPVFGLGFAAPWTVPTTSVPAGPRLTDELDNRLYTVVAHVRRSTLTLQSDVARQLCLDVAAAASLGFITTETDEGFGRIWRVTSRGIAFLEDGTC